MTAATQFEVLDLRHFSAAQLRPLLTDEATRWNLRLQWDYTRSVELLLDYLDNRILPGFVAMQDGRAIAYAFSVYEAAKAVVGDVYAFNESERLENPLCETLLNHLLDMLQATPGIERIESQLLMFPSGALHTPFLSRGFHAYPRLFMSCPLASPTRAAAQAERRLPEDLRLVPWNEDLYQPAGELIHRAYAGHIDSDINNQYRTVHGSLRFLHNIVRFPGCGIFDPGNSWALRDERTRQLHGLLLSSIVRNNVGHITQLCISPQYRGFGLGRALLQRCLAEFRRRQFQALTLTVTESNREALGLYHAFGFTPAHHFEAMVWDSSAD